MDEFEQERQISKYNDASFSISRLHESWLICKQCIRRGNFKRWKIELDNIWLELFPDILRQPNKKELKKRNNKCMILISQSENKTQMFFNLMKRHSFLRECQDLAGKAGIYRDENEEGFE